MPSMRHRFSFPAALVAFSCLLLVFPLASSFQAPALRLTLRSSSLSPRTSLHRSACPLRTSARNLDEQRNLRTFQRRCKIACMAAEDAGEQSKEVQEEEEVGKLPVEELNMKLWKAAEEGNAELIRELVEEGAEVNSQPELQDEDDDEDEEAADGESKPSAEADTSAAGDKPVKEASAASEKKTEKASTEKESGKEEKEKEEKTPEQLEKERKKAEKKAARERKKANAENKGPSALHLAAGNGFSDAACALVDLGGDVNILNDELATPLHFAVAKSHTDTVQVLVTLGADLKSKNKQGQTALAMAVEVGAEEQVITLLKLLMGVTGEEELSK
mmetsp:Transcript_10869/g.26060  ORF Transcript_10869/g.26060 Transcript_10869/m.26060 type:complete len:332 (+) Transcript_10869:254-1249(+)